MLCRALVLFPSDDAIFLDELSHQMSDAQLSKITTLIVIEATWIKAARVAEHASLSKLTRVKIRDRESTFWRKQELGRQYLASIEALYYAAVDFWNMKQRRRREKQGPEVDGSVLIQDHQQFARSSTSSCQSSHTNTLLSLSSTSSPSKSLPVSSHTSKPLLVSSSYSSSSASDQMHSTVACDESPTPSGNLDLDQQSIKCQTSSREPPLTGRSASSDQQELIKKPFEHDEPYASSARTLDDLLLLYAVQHSAVTARYDCYKSNPGSLAPGSPSLTRSSSPLRNDPNGHQGKGKGSHRNLSWAPPEF